MMIIFSCFGYFCLRNFLFGSFILLATIIEGCVPRVLIPSAEQRLESDAFVDSGVVFLRKQQLDDAEAAFQMAYEINPVSAASVDGLGCVEFLRGDTEKSEELWQKAYSMDPNYVHVLNNLALLHQRKGNYYEARRYFQKSLQEDPKNFHTRNNLGVLLFDYERNRAKAEALFRQARTISPDPIIENNLKYIKE